MCFLVNFVKERIQSELVEKLYKVNQLAVEKKSVLACKLQMFQMHFQGYSYPYTPRGVWGGWSDDVTDRSD